MSTRGQSSNWACAERMRFLHRRAVAVGSLRNQSVMRSVLAPFSKLLYSDEIARVHRLLRTCVGFKVPLSEMPTFRA